MAASGKSTREVLLSLVDDIELIAKEMIENTIAQKPMKLSSEEHAQLTELLIAKDDELKATLKRAAEQAKINLKMDASRAEVERQDQDIQQLQRQLKEAEQILATAIYQAKQKLRSIARANERPVSSEELIKYAHRISASNAICAPLMWQQGDPRRPYPTDIEMRLGYLGRLSDLPLNGQMLGGSSHPGISSELHRAGHPVGGDLTPVSQANQFAWHPSGEIHMSFVQRFPMSRRRCCATPSFTCDRILCRNRVSNRTRTGQTGSELLRSEKAREEFTRGKITHRGSRNSSFFFHPSLTDGASSLKLAFWNKIVCTGRCTPDQIPCNLLEPYLCLCMYNKKGLVI